MALSSFQAFQQAARTARMARRAAANADSVFALRFQGEQRVKRHHAVDLRQRDIGLIRHAFQAINHYFIASDAH